MESETRYFVFIFAVVGLIALSGLLLGPKEAPTAMVIAAENTEIVDYHQSPKYEAPTQVIKTVELGQCMEGQVYYPCNCKTIMMGSGYCCSGVPKTTPCN